MAFHPKGWVDEPTELTPVDAAGLVDLETRLAAYTDAQISAVASAPLSVATEVNIEGSGGRLGWNVDVGDPYLLVDEPAGTPTSTTYVHGGWQSWTLGADTSYAQGGFWTAAGYSLAAPVSAGPTNPGYVDLFAKTAGGATEWRTQNEWGSGKVITEMTSAFNIRGGGGPLAWLSADLMAGTPFFQISSTTDPGRGVTLYASTYGILVNGPTSGALLRNYAASGDAQSTFSILGDGRMDWGAGGSTAPDVALRRAAAGALQVDGSVFAAPTSGYGFYAIVPPGNIGFATRQTTDTNDRLYIDTSASKILFGGGSGAADTNLYRQSAGTLQTDGTFVVGGTVVPDAVLATNAVTASRLGEKVQLGAIGPGATAAVLFGSTADVNLYRSGADLLKTDDALIALRGFQASVGGIASTAFRVDTAGDANAKFAIADTGQLSWGVGGATALDTNLSRASAGVLSTTGVFQAAGVIAGPGTANQAYLGLTASATAGPGVAFGSAADVNVYRGGSNQLKSDDDLVVGLSSHASSQLFVGDAINTAGFAGVRNAALSNAVGNYALLQSSTGDTFLNAATGKTVNIAIANVNSLAISSTQISSAVALDMGSHKITSLTDPTVAQDAMTKSYADSHYQVLDATLTALAGLATGASKIPYSTGTDTFGQLSLDTDGTLAGNSDTSVATQKAVKTYADAIATAAAGIYRTVQQAGGAVTSALAAGTYALASGFGNVALATTNGGPAIFYFDPADYAISGKTTKCRVRASLLTNAVAPGTTLTVGLYPVTSVAGGTGVNTAVLGTVTTGSTVAFATPALSTRSQNVSGDFTAPAAGWYMLAVVNSGTTAASSTEAINARLEVRQV